MSEIDIRITGRAGRITLNRPDALNALTPEMCARIDAALQNWAADDAVALVLIDAVGERAFCAGGDITMIYEAGQTGDLTGPRSFWRDEYRMNARIFSYPKPVVTLLQGFTMGGGVGVGCHGSHRIVCDTSRIAMPECGIGLVPDVGGSLLLARAPGHLGEYLGTTAHRMGPADAIYAGFADTFVPHDSWAKLTAELEQTGSTDIITEATTDPGPAPLAALQNQIDAAFTHDTLAICIDALDDSPFARDTRAALARVSPLSAACTIPMIRAARRADTIAAALEMEYRFSHRAIEQADLIEGIRAAVIDKDRTPIWRHASAHDVTETEIAALLAPLGPDTWTLERSS